MNIESVLTLVGMGYDSDHYNGRTIVLTTSALFWMTQPQLDNLLEIESQLSATQKEGLRSVLELGASLLSMNIEGFQSPEMQAEYRYLVSAQIDWDGRKFSVPAMPQELVQLMLRHVSKIKIQTGPAYLPPPSPRPMPSAQPPSVPNGPMRGVNPCKRWGMGPSGTISCLEY